MITFLRKNKHNNYLRKQNLPIRSRIIFIFPYKIKLHQSSSGLSSLSSILRWRREQGRWILTGCSVDVWRNMEGNSSNGSQNLPSTEYQILKLIRHEHRISGSL